MPNCMFISCHVLVAYQLVGMHLYIRARSSTQIDVWLMPPLLLLFMSHSHQRGTTVSTLASSQAPFPLLSTTTAGACCHHPGRSSSITSSMHEARCTQAVHVLSCCSSCGAAVMAAVVLFIVWGSGYGGSCLVHCVGQRLWRQL
jgi:hypothetical protein